MKSLLSALFFSTLASVAGAGETINALLITGQQNHDWIYTSDIHRKTLEESGRFRVDVTTQPPRSLSDSNSLKKYQVFVLDYNGERWGDVAEGNFAAAVSAGTGVVVIHASNNAFLGWSEYEKICGLMWMKDVTGHGKFHNFNVTYVDTDHPITRGLSNMKNHPDELYHKLVNTQKVDFRVLAKAMSSTESGGTGQEEPMALVLNYGKGRVFHTPLGHVWANSPEQHASINDPQFKILLARGAEWAATGTVTLPMTWTEPPKAAGREAATNTLTDAEKAAGWELLFDGNSTDSWRGFKKATFPDKGWEVVDGTVHVKSKGGGGDIVTRRSYENFEFAVEWKASPGANSGIMYLCSEEGFDYPWQTGPEMQILDNKVHPDGKDPRTSAGSLYALIACTPDTAKPAGEWNAARVVKSGKHIEHWLNGAKVLEYEIGSPAWQKLVDASKFKDMPAYGTKAKGYLCLQDHGDDVWFRNIKVLEVK